ARLAKKLLESIRLFRRKLNTEPWSWLVPDLVAMVSTPPPLRPYSAEYEFVWMRNSSTPSMVGRALLAFMLLVFEFIVTGTPSIMMALLESRPPFTVKMPMEWNPSVLMPVAGRRAKTPGV